MGWRWLKRLILLGTFAVLALGGIVLSVTQGRLLSHRQKPCSFSLSPMIAPCARLSGISVCRGL